MIDPARSVRRAAYAERFFEMRRRRGVMASTAAEHNTVYRQTSGVSGYAKTLLSSAVALGERVRTEGVGRLISSIGRKVVRRLKGLPPENK